jgi:arylsulfatase B
MLGLLLGALCALPAQHDNVLLVVLDDLGIDRVPTYAEAPDAGTTPLMDLLAQHGILVRNAYASPICSPTRVGILTGNYPSDYGVGYTFTPDTTHVVGPPVDGTFKHLPQLLPRHRRGAFGKWHMANQSNGGMQHPLLVGYETHKGPSHGLDDYYAWEKYEDGVNVGLVTEYATTHQVNDALEWITSCKADPWFCYLALNAPHTPNHAPPADLHSYTFEGPPPTLNHYKAAVQAADHEIARLLAGLRPEVLARTCVIVMGDNGTPFPWNDPAFAPSKGTVFEGGIGVPLIFYGPGLPAGVEREGLMQQVDLLPTIVELAGYPPPTDRDGVSQVSHLLGGPPVRPMVYSHWQNWPWEIAQGSRAARDERYKLRLNFAGNPFFYDLLADPGENGPLPLGSLSPPQQAAFDALTQFIQAVDPR